MISKVPSLIGYANMIYTSLRHSRHGFTLLELMIAMTIFALMSVMVVMIYFNASYSARKLSMTRELSETAREFIERLENDIKEYGISIQDPKFDPSREYPFWNKLDITWNGNEVIQLGSDSVKKIYVYGRKNSSQWLDPCLPEYQQNPREYCALYIQEWTEYFNITDSFIPEEDKKRVKVEKFRAYISGTNATSKKITLHFVLSLMPRIGVPSSLVGSTKLDIQTTLSERIWKNN